MKILVYTFFAYQKLSSKLLHNLESESFDKCFISSNRSLELLLEKTSKYDIVLGIADHNKRALKSRLDLAYINKYGKRKILNNSADFYKSNLDINQIKLNDFYVFKSYSNGPCNRSAYLIMNKITNSNLQTHFCFSHLSRKNISEDLENLISALTNYTKAT